jgi:hypothetical protein
MSEPIQWTGPLALRALRLAMTSQPTLLRFVLDTARAVLGEHSPEFVAIVLRCAPVPGLSIREMCRERYGWHRSRSELYRRSHNGAVRVAAALMDDGVAVPAGM